MSLDFHTPTLLGWTDPRTGLFTPRFKSVTIRWRRLKVPLDYTLHWWLPAPWHFHSSLHTFSSTDSVSVLLPTASVSCHLRLGVHLYAMHTNGRGQPVQTRVGTGLVPLKELKGGDFKIPIRAENGTLVTELSCATEGASWLDFSDTTLDEDETHHSLDQNPVDPHWTTPTKPFKPDEMQEKFRRRLVQTYLQRPVSVWIWQCLNGEAETDATFYDNALAFGLWVCGKEKPDAHVLAQVIGFFAWSCRYVTDATKTGADTEEWKDTEQFAMIRDHPAEQERSGDCEDLTREMYLAYYWLRESPKAPRVLQQLARAYTFYFVDAIIRVDGQLGLHQYAKLRPRDASSKEEPIFLESTEHVLQSGSNLPYVEKIVENLMPLRAKGTWPKQARWLHTPRTLVEQIQFHQWDLLYFSTTDDPAVPLEGDRSEYGAHPLATTVRLQALPTMAEALTAKELKTKVATVPVLSVPPLGAKWLTSLPPLGRYHSFLKLHHALNDPQLDAVFPVVWQQLSSVGQMVVWCQAKKKYTPVTGPAPTNVRDFFVEIPVTAKHSFCILCIGSLQQL